MSDNTASFLAEMILKLIPPNEMFVDGSGNQIVRRSRFSADEIKRLVAIREVESE